MIKKPIVNTHEAKTHLSKLLEKVCNLIPFKKTPPRRPGLAKGTLPETFFEPLPPDELKAWES